MSADLERMVTPDFEHHVGPDLFSSWLDCKLRIDSIYKINKDSSLDSDCQWLNDNAYELLAFYKLPTVEYACNVFKQKWLMSEATEKKGEESRFQKLSKF